MSRSDCSRYMLARDRELLDEPLSELDRKFCERHERTCVECGREAAAWGAVTGILRESAPLPAAPSLSSAPAEETHPKPEVAANVRAPVPWLSRKHLAVFAAAAGVAVAVGVTAYRRSAAGPDLAYVTRGSVLVNDRQERQGSPLPEGARVRTGADEACVMVPDRVELCLPPGGQLTLSALTSSRREVRLDAGRVTARLAKQPAGDTFSVTTSRGSVTAVGTVFSVEWTSAQIALVQVQEGVVEVRANGSEPVRVAANQRFELGRAPVVPAPESQVSPPPAPSMASGSDAPANAAPSARPAFQASAAERLALARSLRASGNSQAAAEQYRSLQRLYPASSEALVSYVALGQLYLSELGNPSAALRSFDTYLSRGGGALSEEAQYGRIRALHALGRAAQAAQASERFIATYPNSAHAAALRQKRSIGP